MLEFIRKIFKNEEQEAKNIIEISLQNLEEWAGEKSKPVVEEVSLQAEEILMKVSEEVERTRFSLEVLENAKLQNPNIPYKAKQYMEGNRKAYARAVNSFIGHMEINNKDYFYLLTFCREFDELINDLNKGTLRSYTILQEFFANETNKIAQNLKNFDTLFSQLKSILNGRKIVIFNDIKEKIQSLKSKAKQKINLDIEFKNTEAGLKLANAEKDSLMAQITNFNQSDEHNSFLKMSEERKSREKSFYEHESQILQSFSVLDRPLRKYSHVAFEYEELILDYLKNPINTLADDKELRIIEILKNLENMMNENQIKMDEKKKEKSIEEIRKLTWNFLEQFLKEYFSIKAGLEELDSSIKASGVADKLRNLNKKLEEINIRIEMNREEFRQSSNEVDKINNLITNFKSEIENSLRNLFGEEIKIAV